MMFPCGVKDGQKVYRKEAKREPSPSGWYG